MDRVTPLESILQASRITNHPNSCWEHGYPLSEAFLTTDQKDRPSFYLRYRDREAGLGGSGGVGDRNKTRSSGQD